MTTPNADRSTTGSWVIDRVPRLWALWAAARPSQLALISLVYGLGVGIATAGPPLVAFESTTSVADVASPTFHQPILIGAIALLPVAVAIHYANEYVDAETDALTERTPFSGGSGALVRTGLPQSFLRSATIGSVAIASMALVSLTITDRLPLDAVGFLSVIFGLGLAYSLAPIAFVRRGVGEAVNALLGGLLLPLYGVAVVASPRPSAALAVVPFTLLVGCNLFATHWPDRDADAAVGKRTLAVRWSPERIRRAFQTVAVVAVIVTVVLWLVGVFPNAVALAHLTALPFLLWGGAVLTRQRSPFPAVLAMVVLAVTETIAWWWVGITP